MPSAPDHVQPAAPPASEEALRALYVGALGMIEVPRPPVPASRGGGCWFATADRSVRRHLGIEAPFRPASKAHAGLRATGIDALAERIAARGAPVVWDDGLPGHRRFHSTDPVGNRPGSLEPLI